MKFLIAFCLMAALALPGCKIVKTVPGAGDDARIAALLAKTYEAELLPLIAKALPAADLRNALPGGLDVAGKAHGHEGSGEGAAW